MINTLVSVLVVGAGPTGLVAANLLGQFGIQTLLIERNTGLNDSPRAISIDDEGLRICQALGLRDEIVEHVLLDIGAQYYSHGHLLLRVVPNSWRNGYPLISTFNQPRLEATLLRGLRRFSCIEVCFGYTLEMFTQTEQEVLVTVRTPTGQIQKIACAYLFACDGGKSSIRHALGISMCGMSFPQRWLVVDGHCEERADCAGVERPQGLASDRSATFFCDPARPAVSIPAPDQHWRWEFMLYPNEDAECFLTPDHAQQLLLSIGDTRRPHIIRQAIYSFHAFYARSFARGRVFLLGDAAHLLPPFAGQGMNCGLQDAFNLVWKLAFVLSDQAQPALLETYQQERLPYVRNMIRFSSFLGRIVMTKSQTCAFVRDILVGALAKLPFVASTLTEMQIKPEALYKAGFILAETYGQNRFSIGRLLPQPTVFLPENGPVLLDELLGSGFALLRLHTDPNAVFQPLQADLWHKLKVRSLFLISAREQMPVHSESSVSAQDRQQQIARFLRGQGDYCAVIRPDHHVLGLFRVESEQAFVAALWKRFFV